MDTKKAKAITIKWLKDHDFKKIAIQGSFNDYVHKMGDFYTYITFWKDRFDDDYIFDVGCYFEEYGGDVATINVSDLPSNPHKDKYGHSQGFYYNDLTEEQYIQLMDEMYDKYLKPYYEEGLEYVKKVLIHQDTLFEGEPYFIYKNARKRMNELFGLNIQSKH